jgi:hypothetical protein
MLQQEMMWMMICLMHSPVMIHTLETSWAYQLAKSLLGSVQQADELLEEIEEQIARNPESFPIVQLPGTRMASVWVHFGGREAMIGIFFRRLDANKLHLQNLCLSEQSLAA